MSDWVGFRIQQNRNFTSEIPSLHTQCFIKKYKGWTRGGRVERHFETHNTSNECLLISLSTFSLFSTRFLCVLANSLISPKWQEPWGRISARPGDSQPSALLRFIYLYLSRSHSPSVCPGANHWQSAAIACLIGTELPWISRKEINAILSSSKQGP